MADRQDVAEDWISEMAQYAAEICLMRMTKPQVQRIAGPAAVWPEMSKDQIFDLVQIDIRAGSTGKPNRNREREQWMQMLPQIQQAVTQIMQLRQAGQNDMADTVIKLMEETLRRFDERIDIEAFIPPRKQDIQDQQIPPEVQQQMQQLQKALQELQAQNQQLQEAAAGKQQEIEASRESAQVDAEVQLQIARIKANADAAAKVEIARMNLDFERERMAMQERCEMAKIANQPAFEPMNESQPAAD